jgi:hypothetical protein
VLTAVIEFAVREEARNKESFIVTVELIKTALLIFVIPVTFNVEVTLSSEVARDVTITLLITCDPTIRFDMVA